jgi:hypothetical protein
VGQTFCDIFDIALVPKTPVGRQSAHASWGVLLGKVPVWGCVLLADHAVVCVVVPSHRVRSCCRGKQAATIDGGEALVRGRGWSVCVERCIKRESQSTESSQRETIPGMPCAVLSREQRSRQRANGNVPSAALLVLVVVFVVVVMAVRVAE